MKRINIKEAPAAIGPYVQAVRNEKDIFISGQLPINPESNEMVRGTISKQTKQVMENLKNIISSENGEMENIVKITIFLTDMSNIIEMNEVYGNYFSENEFPARSCIQISKLPLDSEIEIEAIVKL